jgi:hypothetical protein
VGDWGQPPLQPGGGFDESTAREKTTLPAVFMMVIAGFSIAVALVVLLVRVLGVSMGSLVPSSAQPSERAASIAFGAVGIVFSVLSIAVNGFVFFGAVKMKNLEHHALAVIAAVATMLPSSLWLCCCFGLNLLPGLAVGIWSLVILFDPGVKAAFRS